MPPRNLGNRNPGSERLGDDPPLLLHRPAPAASYPGANVHPPARELRVAYSVAHMCETFPPNQQEDCNKTRARVTAGCARRLRDSYCLRNSPETDVGGTSASWRIVWRRSSLLSYFLKTQRRRLHAQEHLKFFRGF